MHSLRDTEKKSLFKLGNSELWRPVIPDPVVGSRSVKKRFEILSMSTTYPKLIAVRFSLTLKTAWKKKRTGGETYYRLSHDCCAISGPLCPLLPATRPLLCNIELIRVLLSVCLFCWPENAEIKASRLATNSKSR